MYQQYRPSAQGMPVVVKNILIINVLFFLATLVLGSKFNIDLTKIMGLHYFESPDFMPHQILTHFFMHGSFEHIAFNMLLVWMLGSPLEQVWGPKRFLTFYMATALGAAALHMGVDAYHFYQFKQMMNDYIAAPSAQGLAAFNLDWLSASGTNVYNQLIEANRDVNVSPAIVDETTAFLREVLNFKMSIPTVGASGAGYGILLGFAMLFPNTLLYIYFLFPIKAKYVAAGLALIELYMGIQNNPTDNVAHFAHLGGALVGFLMIKYWNNNNRRSLY